jgi:hypothetical protein
MQSPKALRATAPSAVGFSLYNVAFILFTSFTPILLASLGYGPAAASAVASLPMWLFLVSVPAGGWIAGTSVRRSRLLVALGCTIAAASIVLVWLTGSAAFVVAAGLAGGLPTGPILARATQANPHLPPSLVYGTIFATMFATLMVLPPLVGWAVRSSLGPGALVAVCATMLLLAACADRATRPASA